MEKNDNVLIELLITPETFATLQRTMAWLLVEDLSISVENKDVCIDSKHKITYDNAIQALCNKHLSDIVSDAETSTAEVSLKRNNDKTV